MAAISFSDLLLEVGVSEQQLNSGVSDDHLLKMSVFLTSRERLTPSLGLNEADVEVVETEGRGEEDKRLRMLQRWKHKNAFKATYRKLVEALLSLGMADHAEQVCRLLHPEPAASNGGCSHLLDAEGEGLWRSHEALQKEKELESLQAELSTKTRECEMLARQNDSLHHRIEELQTELFTKAREIDILRENETALLSASRQKDSEISSLRAEIEKIRSEVVSIQADRPRVETESLTAQVQRLSVHHKVASNKSSTELSPHASLLWRRGADAPGGISRAQTVVMGERAYVRGDDYKVYQYDWSQDTWNTLPDCSVKFFGMAQFLDKLITVGGIDRQNSATGKVYQFNDQQWEEFLSPMTTPRSSLTLVTRSSNSPKPPVIAACGGRDARNQRVNTVEVYSHASSQWHTVAPLPIPCHEMTSVTINNTCYLLGGRDSTGSGIKRCISASLDSLMDSATASCSQEDDPIWMFVSDTLLKLSTAASLRGSLLTIGGCDTNTRIGSRAIYVLAGDGSWKRMMRGDLPEPLHRCTAVCLPSGELLVAEGHFRKRTVFIATVVD